MKTLIVSFSGGRTSAFMARVLQIKESKDKDLIFVFANTGKERKETLDFINQCDTEWQLGVVWIEYELIDNKSTYKIVNYNSASREGEPFEKMISKYGIPNQAFSHCTRELKERTISRYLKSIGLKNGDYETAIGIRYDERHRINWDKAKLNNYIYPLATDLIVDKNFIRNWWSRQSFDLNLKDYEGNCDLCWKKSKRKLLTLVKEFPDLINWWKEMEKMYGKGVYSFFRNGMQAEELYEQSKRPFQKVIDGHSLASNQISIFDFEMDMEYDCFCKSS